MSFLDFPIFSSNLWNTNRNNSYLSDETSFLITPLIDSVKSEVAVRVISSGFRSFHFLIEPPKLKQLT